MNEEEVIKNVVELLKGINNSAAEMVCSGDLNSAIKMYETGEQTSQKFCYTEGAFLNRLYIVKIHIMQERYDLALSGLDRLETYEISEKSKKELDSFYKEASWVLLKSGIEMEKDGNLKSALKIFEKILPYLNQKRAQAVEKEIVWLKSKIGAVKSI